MAYGCHFSSASQFRERGWAVIARPRFSSPGSKSSSECVEAYFVTTPPVPNARLTQCADELSLKESCHISASSCRSDSHLWLVAAQTTLYVYMCTYIYIDIMCMYKDAHNGFSFLVFNSSLHGFYFSLQKKRYIILTSYACIQHVFILYSYKSP